MAVLERLWVIHTTSTDEHADTTDSFSLELRTPTGHIVMWFPHLSENERQRGSTDEYEFDLRDFDIDHEELTPDKIKITTRGSDDWLPKSIWVIGRTVDGRFHLLVARPDWPPNAWFGTHRDQGMPSRSLDQPPGIQAQGVDDLAGVPPSRAWH